jgi:uncharacterized membrane protein YoaT (DUF817 family)
MSSWSNDKNKVIWTLILVMPVGVYLMWKGKHFSKDIRWWITGLLLVLSYFVTKELHEWYLSQNANCSPTIILNGCVVQLDEYCRVVSQTCD